MKAPDITKGPYGIRTAEDGSRAIFSGKTGQWVALALKGSFKSEQEANATLIAAAPRLAKALNELLEATEKHNPLARGCGLAVTLHKKCGEARAALLEAGYTLEDGE